MFKRWSKAHDRVALDAKVLILTYGDEARNVAMKRSEKAIGWGEDNPGTRHWDLVGKAIARAEDAQTKAA
jgi:hypothetical protein